MVDEILFMIFGLFPIAALIVLLYGWGEAFIKNKYKGKKKKKK